MAETEGGAKELFQLIIHKPALLIAILVGAGVLVYLLIKNGPQGTSAPASTGLTTNAPPDYSAYQSGYDAGYQRGSYSVPTPAASANNQSNTPPSSTSPIPDHPTDTTTVTFPIQTTTIGATNPQNTYGIFATIRQATTQGSLAPWDKTFASQGIPIRDKPGGNIISYDQFGSSSEITGSAVTGPENFGNTTWYKLKSGGYVSGLDVTNLQSQQEK